MKPAVAEWVSKAEGDFATAGRELRARKAPNYDAVCFHTQQCAEKYLKAVLQAEGKHIPKIHNLIELMLLCLQIDSTFEMLRANLIVMERYSVRAAALPYNPIFLTELHRSQSSRWQSNASGSILINS